MAEEPFTNPELDAIGNAQCAGDRYNLTTEVFWSAMHYLKRNPQATIEEACTYGVMEWIK